MLSTNVMMGKSKSIPNIWSEQQPAGNLDRNWYNCSINSNGDAIAGAYGSRLYTYE